MVFFRDWRRQVTTLTKNGAKKLTNPMIPDSEMPDIRLTKEAEFKLYMASALRDAGLKTRDRGFLQSRCQRCFLPTRQENHVQNMYQAGWSRMLYGMGVTMWGSHRTVFSLLDQKEGLVACPAV